MRTMAERGVQRRTTRWLTAGLALLFAGSNAGAAETPADVAFVLPETSDYSTNEGTVQLAWQVAGEEIGSTNLNFEIQRTTDAAFESAELYYAGPENGTFVSGMPAGDYYFRARSVAVDGSTGTWSAIPVHVTVEYASATLVKTLMLVGTLVFIATVIVVVKGHRQATRNNPVALNAKS